MSKNISSESFFTNEQTRQRRAWIERALASVRGKVRQAEELAESDAKSCRPRLHVVSSNRTR